MDQGKRLEVILRRSLCAKVLLGLLFLVTGCRQADVPPVAPTSVSTLGTTSLAYVVQRGSVTKILEFSGRISPVEEVPLYFKIGGYVKRVLVQPGDQVKTGDLLAALEAEAEAEGPQNQIVLAELNLAVAQAGLSQAEEANAYAITQAELLLVLAQEQLARARALRATFTAATVHARVGLEQAEDQVARAEIAYQQALARPWEPTEVRDGQAFVLQQARWILEMAQADHDLAVANEEVYQRDLKIAEIAVKQAEAQLTELKKGVDPVLAINVQQAQQVLDWLKESSQIVAPVDGEVISLSLYPGRPVEPFRTSITIADLSAIEVSAPLSNDQLEEITEGQEAIVALSVHLGRTWTGIVRRLPYPYGTGSSIESPASPDNSTRISLEGDLSELKLGDLVRVTIVLEGKDDVLWLPPDAIRTFQGRSFVIVQDGERQRRVDVELGIAGQDQVEILKGLEQGQVVVAP